MRILKTILLATAMFAIACNHSSKNSKEMAEYKNISLKEQEADKFLPQEGNAATDTTARVQHQKQQLPQTDNEEKNADWDKKIVKTATIEMEVKNFNLFSEALHGDIKKYGGYIAQEEQNETDYKIENVIAIKVPVDQFDNLATELTSGEQKLLEKKITSEDVTSEVVDTKSRMEAKKQVRLRYLDLLKQAKNMEDILNVQNEINGIQEDIEAAAGRVEYLSHSAAYSTINITYFQVLNASAKDENEISYGQKIWLSFKNGWNWVGEVFVGLVSIWPLFLLGFVCWFTYKRWAHLKIQKKNA